MGRIAFFSDDDAGPLCARLVSLGLASLGTSPVLVLEPFHAPRTPDPERPDGGRVVALAEGANAFDVELALREASRSSDDVVAALPLAGVGDNVLRSQFDAIVTVGTSPAAATRAMRAARYDTGHYRSSAAARRRATPAWFLAGPDQTLLTTEARLSATDGPPLPFATRMLPTVLPRSLAMGCGDFTDMASNRVVLGTAVLLTALALAVAADPWAKRLDANGLAALMAARTLPTERALSDRLLELASSYDRLAGAAGFDEAADGLLASQPPRTHGRRALIVRSQPAAPRSVVPAMRRAYRG